MATTYLDVTNSILAETNETRLTSSNFANAVGIQAYAKDIVNRAYLKICSHKKEWPFLSAASGNINDPFAGNVILEVQKGIRWYLLKEGSAGVSTDFGKVDWDSFFLTSYNAPDRESPWVNKNLEVISFDRWADWFRAGEMDDATGDQKYGVPERVVRSTDGRYVGISPIPDDNYKLYFTAWNRPVRLENSNDVLLIPDEYVPVLVDYARYLMYQFKENIPQSQAAELDYRQGLRDMVHHLIGTDNKDFTDDRIRY